MYFISRISKFILCYKLFHSDLTIAESIHVYMLADPARIISDSCASLCVFVSMSPASSPPSATAHLFYLHKLQRTKTP
uniref:Uncharacterized protein n=1 Tax=Kalanchoe fedtschenkoi TaxID=63787 RepID=A0A7N0VMU3_KALFE